MLVVDFYGDVGGIMKEPLLPYHAESNSLPIPIITDTFIPLMSWEPVAIAINPDYARTS